MGTRQFSAQWQKGDPMPFKRFLLVASALLAFTLTSTGDPPVPASKSPPPPYTQNLLQAGLPVGRWSVQFANAVAETCEIGNDGKASVVEPSRTSRGKATHKDGAVVIVFDDDRVERWTPVGRQMVVEHWFPGGRFPSEESVLGIAEKETMAWGPVTKGLQMSVRLEKAQYRYGESIQLDVLIRRTANEEADLGMSVSDLSSFDFDVRYVSGGMAQAGRMPLTKYGAKLLEDHEAVKNIRIWLKAGEQRPYQFPLNRLVDMTLSGTYSVTVHRYVPGRPRHDSEDHPRQPGPRKPDDLVSNELSVEIRELPIASR
jgi:hypothetical protein